MTDYYYNFVPRSSNAGFRRVRFEHILSLIVSVLKSNRVACIAYSMLSQHKSSINFGVDQY